MFHHLVTPTLWGEKFGNVLHFALAAVFGLMTLHAAVHVFMHLV
jgi:hypothetical protein